MMSLTVTSAVSRDAGDDLTNDRSPRVARARVPSSRTRSPPSSPGVAQPPSLRASARAASTPTTSPAPSRARARARRRRSSSSSSPMTLCPCARMRRSARSTSPVTVGVPPPPPPPPAVAPPLSAPFSRSGSRSAAASSAAALTRSIVSDICAAANDVPSMSQDGTPRGEEPPPGIRPRTRRGARNLRRGCRARPG